MTPEMPALDVTRAWQSQLLEHDRPLLCCRFSPCGRFIFAGAQDDGLWRWDLASGAKSRLTGHESWVHALACHPGEPRLLAGDLWGALRCWDSATDNPEPVWTVPTAHPGWITTATVTHDGTRWITAGTDGVIRFWNAPDGQLVSELPTHGTEVYSLAVHPAGRHLCSGDLLGRIHVWNLESLDLERTIDAGVLHTRKEDFLADVGGVRSLAFHPDGSQLAAGGMTDIESNAFCPGKPAVLVYDFDMGLLKRTLRMQTKSDGPIKGLVFLENGALAAHAEHLNATSSLEFFSPEQAEPVHVIARESSYALALHPDGRRLAAAGYLPHGRGGNGRQAQPGEYVTNHGALTIYSLFEKPAA